MDSARHRTLTSVVRWVGNFCNPRMVTKSPPVPSLGSRADAYFPFGPITAIPELRSTNLIRSS